MTNPNDLLAEVARKHRTRGPDYPSARDSMYCTSGWCVECDEAWPCLTSRLAARVRELEAREDDYRRQVIAGVYDAASVGIVLIDSTELAALRADRDRLDWLALHPAQIAYWDNTQDGDVFRPCGADYRPIGPPMPLCDAIDAARKEEP